jgi:hypothetical protein
VVLWIVIGAVVLGVLILGASLAALAGRFRPLDRAGRRLRLRADEAQRLQAKLAVTQERIEALQEPLAEAAARAEGLRGTSPVDDG